MAKKTKKKAKTRTKAAKPAKRKAAKKTATKRPAAKAKKTKKTKSAKRPAKRAAAKPAKRAAAKPVKRKTRDVIGEGNYTASRNFRKKEEAFVAANKTRIPALGKQAEAALDGPEGDELRRAEEESGARGQD